MMFALWGCLRSFALHPLAPDVFSEHRKQRICCSRFRQQVRSRAQFYGRNSAVTASTIADTSVVARYTAAAFKKKSCVLYTRVPAFIYCDTFQHVCLEPRSVRQHVAVPGDLTIALALQPWRSSNTPPFLQSMDNSESIAMFGVRTFAVGRVRSLYALAC